MTFLRLAAATLTMIGLWMLLVLAAWGVWKTANAYADTRAGGGRVPACRTVQACHQAISWQKKHAADLRRELAVKNAPTLDYACALGQAAFGVPVAHCKRVVGCESGGDPRQVTLPTYASGFAQFEPGTWRGTRFARFSIFDPIASVLAMDQIAAREGFDTSYGWAASYHCHHLSGAES